MPISENDPYHYPTELLELLVETIPRLVKSKSSVLDFFRSAGVSGALTDDLRDKLRRDKDSVNKFGITKTVLKRLNESGDTTIRERREVLKRVIEWEDYSASWPEDQLKAKGLVAEIRRVQYVKDAFTKINLERQKEIDRRRSKYEADKAAIRERKASLGILRDRLAACFGNQNVQRRGKELEEILNGYFKEEGVSVREAFHVVGTEGEGIIEQIDGAIEIDGALYLVEMKWWKKTLGTEEVAPFLVKVFHRGSCGGMFIANPGVTGPAITHFKDALTKGATVFGCTLKSLYGLLEAQGNLKQFLRERCNAAKLDKKPFLEGDIS